MTPTRFEGARAMIAVFVLCALAASAGAQAPAPSLTPDECYRFAFGTWAPPLNPVSRKTSEPSTPDTSPPARTSSPAPDWAARLPTKVGATATAADSELVLFPGWWPAGIGITWTATRGDTLIGVARAFVADGRLRVPTSEARAIRIPCVRT